jgi:hypothetical protein
VTSVAELSPSHAGHRHTGRLRVFVAAAALTLVVAASAHRAALLGERPGEGSSRLLVDFAEQIYYPERSFLEGSNPYRGYPVPNSLAGYPPHTLLFHLPFGLLDYATAALAYQLFTICMTVALACAAVWFGGRSGSAATQALAAALLASRPGHLNFINGTVTGQVILGTYVALHYARARPVVAATGVAVSLIKPTIGVPLAVQMLAGRGDVRSVILGSTVAAVLSAAVVGLILPAAGGPRLLVESVLRGVRAFSAAPESNPLSAWMRVDAIALVAKGLGRVLPAPAEVAVSLALLACGVFTIRRFVARGGSPDSPMVTMIVCLTIVVCTYQQAYGLLILALPVVALVVDSEAMSMVCPPRLRSIYLALLAFPFLNYLSSYTVLDRLGVTGWRWTLLTSLSSLALFTAWVITLSGALRFTATGRSHPDARRLPREML